MSKREVFPTFCAAGYLLLWMWRLIRPLLGIMVLGLLAGGVILNMTSGRALESDLAQIRQKGEPISLREAAPPMVPDDENAAPIYKKAFLSLPRLVPASPTTGRMNPQLSPDDERLLRRLLSDRNERPGNVSMQQVREVLAGTDAALALFRKAAAMPRCRFPVDWEAGAGAVFPHYTELLALTRLTGAHAILAADEGDPTAAMADLDAIIGMARHLSNEPILIGLMIQYRCLYIAGNSLERVLETTSPTEAECRQLDQKLAVVDLDDSFERAVESERCLGLWCFEVAARSDPANLPAILGVDHPIVWLSTRLGPFGSPLLKMDELFYLRSMARQVDQAKQRDRRLPAKSAEAEMRFPWYATISRVVFPALQRVRDRRNEARAGLALARCGLALSVYHQKTGQFPASLADAERVVGWSLPSDPLTGRALVYHPQGSGYILYSLGINGRDDGGQNAKERRHSAASHVSPDQDDIAWWFGSEPGTVR